jgi:tRNA dimethylallyltransferase
VPSSPPPPAALPALPPLLALLGPTAAGKTAAAVALARELPIEVIAADSRQLRRGMRIGTAAPTEAELAAVPHQLVGIAEPDAPWTLADWLAGARAAITACHERGRMPLLVAGTGQYAWALLEGWRVPAVPPNPALRAELEVLAAREGAGVLLQRLQHVDPASARRIGESNARRLVRAIEIVEATGAPVPPLERGDAGFAWRAVGLRRPRADLYARADERATAMYAAGLVEEARALIRRHGASFPALASVGYAEAARVLDGSWSLDQALARTQTATHRLIRQQATWFRAGDARIRWVDAVDGDEVTRVLLEEARSLAPEREARAAGAPPAAMR